MPWALGLRLGTRILELTGVVDPNGSKKAKYSNFSDFLDETNAIA
jgi:hypothetical protein